MKCFSIMLDDIAHTAIYLIRASSEKEAIEKFSVKETGVERLIDGRWLLRDGVDKRFDKLFQSTDDFVDNYWKKSSNRFEIMEIVFDIENDVQGIFCSKEKTAD